jgi:tRNA threonylcarbamoyladenosine biosynthesis protein TsaB
MYKLYLDTTTRYEKSVSLKKDEKVLGERAGDIDVVSAIKELLAENKLTVQDISEVVPNKGPGSFTGLKVGVTIANILNWINGAKKLDELDMPEYGAEPNIQT